MADQNGSEIDVTCSSDTQNPRFTEAMWLMLGCLDAPVAQKEATLPLVCREKKNGSEGG